MMAYHVLANGCDEKVEDLVQAVIVIMNNCSDEITVGADILEKLK